MNHRNRKSNTLDWQILTIKEKDIGTQHLSDIVHELTSCEGREQFAELANIIKGDSDQYYLYQPRAA